MTNGRHFLKFWLPVYVYAAIIFIFSSQSITTFGPSIFLLDKLLHVFEYAILGYLLARAAGCSSNQALKAHFRIFAVCLGALYGVSDEFHQYFVPGREVEVLDVLSDGAGALLGQMFWKG